MSTARTLRRTARALVGVSLAGLLASAMTGLVTSPAAAEPTRSPVAVPAAQVVPAAGGDTCRSPYVWREARSGDVVCVTVDTREQTRRENAATESHRDPKGAYGPRSCASGYVWREAYHGDTTCVRPDRRDQAKKDNAQAGVRRLGELKPPPELTCKSDGTPTNGFSGNRYNGPPMRWSNRGTNDKQGSPGLGAQYDRCTKTVTVYFDAAAGKPTHYNLTVNGQHHEVKVGRGNVHTMPFPVSKFGSGSAAFTLQSCEKGTFSSDCSVRSPEIRVDVRP